jgi:hypothetical protein
MIEKRKIDFDINIANPAIEYATCSHIAMLIPVAVYIPAVLLYIILFLETIKKSGPGLIAIKIDMLVIVKNSVDSVKIDNSIFNIL